VGYPNTRPPESRASTPGKGHVPSGHLLPPAGPVIITGMRCQECEVQPAGIAKGWVALLIDLDDDSQDEVVFYCPVCSEREFGSVE
jgi:hypothetical protein